MTTFAAPLPAQEARVIAHAIELFMVVASTQQSTLEDVERYALARRWLVQLLQGHTVDIPEELLAESRRIMDFRRYEKATP